MLPSIRRKATAGLARSRLPLFSRALVEADGVVELFEVQRVRRFQHPARFCSPRGWRTCVASGRWRNGPPSVTWYGR